MWRVLVGSVCLVLAMSGCSKDDEKTAAPAPTTAVPSTPTPTPTPSPTEDAPDPKAPAITYGTDDDPGATIAAPADAQGLSKAPDDFRAFIAAELTRVQNEAGNECTRQPQIRVNSVQAAGWASGGVFTPECGGYAVLWAKQGGQWSQVWGGQELVDCATLVRYRFPVSVAGKQCLSQEGASTTYAG